MWDSSCTCGRLTRIGKMQWRWFSVCGHCTVDQGSSLDPSLYAIEIITYLISCIWIRTSQPVGMWNMTILCTLHDWMFVVVVLIIVIATQVLEFSFCAQKNGSPIWAKTEDTFTATLFVIIDCAQLTLGALMCLLVAIWFVRESLRMYRARKQLQLNRCMSLLAWEGTIYFLAYVPSFHFLFHEVKLMANYYA